MILLSVLVHLCFIGRYRQCAKSYYCDSYAPIYIHYCSVIISYFILLGIAEADWLFGGYADAPPEVEAELDQLSRHVPSAVLRSGAHAGQSAGEQRTHQSHDRPAATHGRGEIATFKMKSPY